MRECFKNLFKIIVVYKNFSGSILKIKKIFCIRMVKWRHSYHSKTNGKIHLQNPGKLRIFSPIFRPSLKSGTPISQKSVFKINKNRYFFPNFLNRYFFEYKNYFTVTLHFTKHLMALMKQKYLFLIQVCPEIIAVCPDPAVLHSCSGAVPQVMVINDGSNVRWWP